MVLRGVLEKSFGSFLCLRGFAPMGELAKCSVSDEKNYQRKTDDPHVNDIRAFFENKIEDLFFPEVILGVSLEELGATLEEQEWLFKEALEKGGSRHPIGSAVKASVYSKKFTEPDGRVVVYNTGSFYGLDIQRLIYRIDGNHRLEAAEGPLPEDIKNRPIPFCLIIFQSEATCKRKSATFFSNINFKALPISREMNVKNVVENDDISDDVLLSDTAFGPGYLFCRKLIKHRRDATAFSDFIGSESPHAFLQELGDQLFSEDERSCTNEVCEQIYDFLIKWLERWPLKQYGGFSEFSHVVRLAMAYYHWKDESAYEESIEANSTDHNGSRSAKGCCTQFARFLSWIKNNHLEKLNGIALSDFLSVFDNVYKALPKQMFLARWYPETGAEKRKADARYDALSKIAESENLKLIDMEHMRRGAFSIRDAIDKAIPNSDLFVADLTGVRPNVMIEIGMALHHLPMNRVLFYIQKAEEVPGMDGPGEKPPFDLSGYSYDTIVDSSEIERFVLPRIRGILNEMSGGNTIDEIEVPVAEECDGTPDDNDVQQG